jgi:hypothetical protein
MTTPGDGHDPVIVPYGTAADRVILRCDCGCGLYQTHGTREAARAALREMEGPT